MNTELIRLVRNALEVADLVNRGRLGPKVLELYCERIVGVLLAWSGVERARSHASDA